MQWRACRPGCGVLSSLLVPSVLLMLRVLLFSSVMMMIRWLVIGLAVYLTSWVVLVALARRLPPGLLREVAEFLPACVTAARRLRRCPDVPRRAKLALLAAVLWVVSPIDLLPEFLPVIGPLDDVVAVVLLRPRSATRVMGCIASLSDARERGYLPLIPASRR